MFNNSSKTVRCISLLILFCGLNGQASAQKNVSSPQVSQTIENSRANNAFWSVTARDSTGKILEGYHAKKHSRPASNIKLFTSAAILNGLRPGFTFSTNMYGVGHLSGNTWKGDIIFRGVGDPSISGTYYNDDRLHVFDQFFLALDSLGIKKVDGNLIGNDSYFDQQAYPKGWSWQDLSYYYGVEVNALSFNNNAVDLTVYADGQIGDAPRIEWFPFDTDYVTFLNHQVITPPNTEYDEFYRRLMGTNTIVLGSTLPKNYVEKESLSIYNAPRFFLDSFKKYMEGGGITLNGHIIVEDRNQDWNDDKYNLIFSHKSKPLSQLLKQVNRESNNFYTEMLLKTLAANHFDVQGTTELGLQLVKDFANTAAIDTSGLELTDGSGMAPSTLTTTADLSRLLVYMQHSPYFDAYWQSLAVAGVCGSLKNRFTGTSLAGNIHGKTGFVTGVRALSGYMDAASGKPLVFSVITNNYTVKTSYIDYIQGKIVKALNNKY